VQVAIRRFHRRPHLLLLQTVLTLGRPSQTHLWGYWDLYFDFEAQTVEAVPNHHAEFAANVVSFLNSKGGLGFNILETLVDPAFIDVDIDVSLTHPLSGLPMYDGYDVRGVFIGDGSEGLLYDSDLDATNLNNEQYMLDDPDDADGGGPDGYTRWFNPDEFPAPGLLGYLHGNVATPGYVGDATLNPYKYFADDLGDDDDLWDFLTTTTDNGVFTSGTTNTRNYYLRFPMPTPGVSYGYAVVANWEGETIHPANATEEISSPTFLSLTGVQNLTLSVSWTSTSSMSRQNWPQLFTKPHPQT